MESNSAEAAKRIIAQISGAVRNCYVSISWKPLAAEYGLDEFVSDWLVRKASFGDWNELSEAVYSFLNKSFEKKPADTIMFLRRLAHEIVDQIPEGSEIAKTLIEKHAVVLKIGREPISEDILQLGLPTMGAGADFIDPAGYSGFLLSLVEEINNCYMCKCPVATAMLSRKLLESLVISIMQKKYGSTNPDFYMMPDGRSKPIKEILKKFWSEFGKDLKPFSATTDNSGIDKAKTLLEDIKDGFNVDAHQLGTYTNMKALIDKRPDLLHVLKFLKHIDERVK